MIPLFKVPFKLCGECMHKRNPQGGHCYMFKDEPGGNYCGQFQIDPKAKHAESAAIRGTAK